MYVYTWTQIHIQFLSYVVKLAKTSWLMIYYLSVYTREKLYIYTNTLISNWERKIHLNFWFSLTFKFLSNSENHSSLAGLSPLSVPASFHPPHFIPKFPVGQDGGNTRSHSYMEVWVISEGKGYLRCGFAKNVQVISYHFERGFGRLLILHPTSTTTFSYPTMFFDQQFTKEKRSKIIREVFT